MIPSEFIDELLNKIDVVDVIEEFVPLKKAVPTTWPAALFTKKNLLPFLSAPANSFIIALAAAYMVQPLALSWNIKD